MNAENRGEASARFPLEMMIPIGSCSSSTCVAVFMCDSTDLGTSRCGSNCARYS